MVIFAQALNIETFVEVWLSGGWVMVPLVFLAFIIYFTAMEMMLFFRRGNHDKVPEAQYEKWIDDPARGEGHVGEIISYVRDESADSTEEVRNRFVEISTAALPVVDSG